MRKRENMMGNKFVTLIFLIYSTEGVTANVCTTTVPQGVENWCGSLTVVNGKACYTGSSAYVSCDNKFSLDTSQTFTCTVVQGSKYWTPSVTPTCVPTATPASTSLQTQFDTTESMYSTTFSILMPSEKSLFETEFLSATRSMKTSVLPSHTVISDYSTIQQTGIQTISVTVTVTSNSVSDSGNNGMIAVYVLVPVIVITLAIFFTVFIWRKSPSKCMHTLDDEHAWNQNSSAYYENQKHNTQQSDNEYEGTRDSQRIQLESLGVAYYNTVDDIQRFQRNYENVKNSKIGDESRNQTEAKCESKYKNASFQCYESLRKDSQEKDNSYDCLNTQE
ncbi:uncharacterized protein LOC128556636 [Mercenaria mercenaria]|uniref:uncharacterized protein LOC128556636 n=1 Tax=Mercenaria mercenaria TaxID=6596 RepID=UPI00234EE630|nr:uncharacterized protein LOC128556636 [Mercenaria mercenaria]